VQDVIVVVPPPAPAQPEAKATKTPSFAVIGAAIGGVVFVALALTFGLALFIYRVKQRREKRFGECDVCASSFDSMILTM
jgi:hypothetical protein